MRTLALSSFQSRYSLSDKSNLNFFRWPNVFLMQPRDLCCCQSAGFIGMLGCKWAADRDQEKKKVAEINRSGRDITFDQIHIDWDHWEGCICASQEMGCSTCLGCRINELSLFKRAFDKTIRIDLRSNSCYWYRVEAGEFVTAKRFNGNVINSRCSLCVDPFLHRLQIWLNNVWQQTLF